MLLKALSAVLFVTLLAPGPAVAGHVQFGLFETVTDSTGCVSGAGLRLSSGDSLSIVFRDAFNDSFEVFRAHVRALRAEPCRERQGVFGDSVFYYDVDMEPAEESRWGLGLAADAPGITAPRDAKHIEFRIRGEEAPYIISRCTSMEGEHWFVRREGHLKWHEYYYLPYDTESDCTDEDFADVPAR